MRSGSVIGVSAFIALHPCGRSEGVKTVRRFSYSETRVTVPRNHGGQVDATPRSGDLAQHSKGHTNSGFALTPHQRSNENVPHKWREFEISSMVNTGASSPEKNAASSVLPDTYVAIHRVSSVPQSVL
jgi:hypothetical protein